MYATDFFDQLEHRIVPALRSGAVVLADRFISPSSPAASFAA